MATTKAKKPATKTTKTKATTKNAKPNKCIIAVVILAVIALVATVVTAAIVVNTKKPSVIGKYTLVASINENGEEDTSTVDTLKVFGAKYIAEFKEDKTGSLKAELDGSGLGALMGENTDTSELATINFTYDGNTIKATNDEGEVSEATYTYKDGIVTITMGTETMKFTRAE